LSKIILLLFLTFGASTFAQEDQVGEVQYFCQNYLGPKLQTYRNGDPKFLKLKIIEHEWGNSKIDMELFDYDINYSPSFKIFCERSNFYASTRYDLYICGEGVFGFISRITAMFYVTKRIIEREYEAIRLDFYDARSAANTFGARKIEDTNRKFRCNRRVIP